MKYQEKKNPVAIRVGRPDLEYQTGTEGVL